MDTKAKLISLYLSREIYLYWDFWDSHVQYLMLF